MSEDRNRDNINPERDEATFKPERDENAVKQTVGRIVAVIGMFFALVGVVTAIANGDASITGGAVGVMLGIIGYFLGSNRLGTIAVVFSIVALFFSLAVNQGYVPGIDASDRNLPSRSVDSGDSR